jgi:hypothetical protein
MIMSTGKLHIMDAWSDRGSIGIWMKLQPVIGERHCLFFGLTTLGREESLERLRWTERHRGDISYELRTLMEGETHAHG